LVNVFKIGNSIVATQLNYRIIQGWRQSNSIIRDLFPRANDIVIGKMLTIHLSWSVNINSCFAAHLPAQDIFGRDFSPAHDDMGRQLSSGDVMRKLHFDRQGSILTIQDKDLGKIPAGELIKYHQPAFQDLWEKEDP
jgi:exosome complex component RRP4